jgi:uncharacterized spore protein YtfJ
MERGSGTMNVDAALEGARDAMTARGVFGKPVERDGVVVIPAARVSGGAGGGGGGDTEGNGGAGSGFGLTARPVGAFVLKGGEVIWRPAVDVTRVVVGAQLVAVAGLIYLRARARARARQARAEARAR